MWVQSLGQREIPWSKKWQPTPVFLPGKFHGQRNLTGYSPQRCEQSDMTECTHTHMSRFKNDGLIHTYAHIDTTNLCVCAKAQQLCPTLCSPTDRGAWQATFVGFPRQEYRSGLPCHPPGGLPNPGIKPTSLMSPTLADRFFTTCVQTKVYYNSLFFPLNFRVNQNLV